MSDNRNINLVEDIIESEAGRKSKAVANRRLQEMNNSDQTKGTDVNEVIEVIKENVSEVNLNLQKQYRKESQHCDRDLFKIHDPKVNKKEKG